MSQIWWADVIRAHEAFDEAPGALPAVAKALGFEIVSHRATPESRPPPKDLAADRRAAAPERPDPVAPTEPPEAMLPADLADVSVLEPIADEHVEVSLPDGQVLPGPEPAPQVRVLPHRSLIRPRAAGSILHYLMAQTVQDGPSDLDKLVSTIANGRPVNVVPRQPERTLRFGAEVMLDLSENMELFRRDQADIANTVRAVVGVSATTVRYFADTPLRGSGPGPRWTWRDYRPPARGTSVLLLTDFGVGGDRLSPRRASTDEWVAFFALLRRHGCQPAALVPYPPGRWPRTLRTLCPMLTWDHSVTVGQALVARR